MGLQSADDRQKPALHASSLWPPIKASSIRRPSAKHNLQGGRRSGNNETLLVLNSPSDT